MTRLWILGMLLVPALALAQKAADKSKGTGKPSAAAKRAGEEAADESLEEEGEDRKSNHFKSFTKIRAGSVLRSDEPEPPPPDLRGLIERRRDWEVVAHFRRLAELDVITELAVQNNEPELADRAEAIRRIEIERFRLAMRRLRSVIQAKTLTGVQ